MNSDNDTNLNTEDNHIINTNSDTNSDTNTEVHNNTNSEPTIDDIDNTYPNSSHQYTYNRPYRPVYLPMDFYTTNYNIIPLFTSPYTPSPSVQNTSLYDKPAYKKIISENALNNIIPFPYHQLTEQDKQYNSHCCISQEPFQEEDEVIQLNCKHVFHKEPILHWLQNEKALCPVCRYEYESIEIKNNINDNVDQSEEDEEIPPLVTDHQYNYGILSQFSLLEYLEQLYYDNQNQQRT